MTGGVDVGIDAEALGSGNVTVTVDGSVVGAGAGGAAAGSAILARSRDGSSLVTLGNVASAPFSVVGNHTDAVLAVGSDGFAPGNTSAVVNVTDPGNVTLTFGTKAAAITAVTFSSGSGSSAVVNMTGAAGGMISAEDPGGNIAGVGAYSEVAGSSSITTNTGRTISVGTNGGNNDVGLIAQSSDVTGTQSATVTLGDKNIVTVGNTTSSGAVGVEATNLPPTGWSMASTVSSLSARPAPWPWSP